MNSIAASSSGPIALWVRASKRSPVRGSVVELRKILDVDDFADSFPAELAVAEERAREKSATKPK